MQTSASAVVCVLASCLVLAGCDSHLANSGNAAPEPHTTTAPPAAVSASVPQTPETTEPAVGTNSAASAPLPAQSAEIGVRDTNEGQPVNLALEEAIEGVFVSPAEGAITMLHITVGNYGGTSDGELSARLCVAQRCVEAQKPISESVDNAYFAFQLGQALPVDENTPITYTIKRVSGTQPLAIWSYSRSNDGRVQSFKDPSGAASDRTPRLAVTYQ